MKHTPGPWKIDSTKLFVITADDNPNGCIACSPSPRQWKRADAKLIAKAPEMLELLKEFVHRVEIGEVRSKKTYTKFKEIIKEIEDED